MIWLDFNKHTLKWVEQQGHICDAQALPQNCFES